MANKKIEIRPVGDGDFGDILFPKTSADMVIDEVNGGTVADFITEVRNTPPPDVAPKVEASVFYVGDAVYTNEGGLSGLNKLTLTLPTNVNLVDGLGLSFKCPSIAFHGPEFKIIVNGTEYTLHKTNRTTARVKDLSSYCIYTIRYSASHSLFFLQGEGGDYGNATAGHVLAGATFGTDNGLVTGTIPDNRQTTTTGTRRASASGYIDLSPALGYYSGNVGSNTRISDSNFTAANIKSGISMFGLTGNFTGNYVTKETTVQLNAGVTTYTVPFTNLGFTPKYWIASVGALKFNGQSLALSGLIPPLGCPNMSVYSGNTGAYYMGALRGQYDSAIGKYSYTWDTIVSENGTNKSYTSGTTLYYNLDFFQTSFSTYRFDTQVLTIRIDAWS